MTSRSLETSRFNFICPHVSAGIGSYWWRLLLTCQAVDIYASAKILSLLIWSIGWIEQEVGNSFWYVSILLEKLAKRKYGVGQIPKALFSDDVLRIHKMLTIILKKILVSL